MSNLTQFRQQIDDFMGHHPQSPLGHDARYDFSGLKYYDEADDWVIETES